MGFGGSYAIEGTWKWQGLQREVVVDVHVRSDPVLKLEPETGIQICLRGRPWGFAGGECVDPNDVRCTTLQVKVAAMSANDCTLGVVAPSVGYDPAELV
jgi:hypothetical protein